MQKLNKLANIAKSLYESNYAMIQTIDYLTYLGGGLKALNETNLDISIIRCLYLSCFRWNVDLLKSLRLLCDKLFFKGESQFIDKILDSFSESWFQIYGVQNNKSLFGNSNGVYLVSYSLILLNTDLHSYEIEKRKRITKSKFVKNTILALQQNKVPIKDIIKLSNELKMFYEAMATTKLKLTGQEPTTPQQSQSTLPPRHIAMKRASLASLSNSVRPRVMSRFSDRDSIYSNATTQTGMTFTTTASEFPTNGGPVDHSYGFAKALMTEKRLKRKTSLDSGRISINSSYSSVVQRLNDNTDYSILADDNLTTNYIIEEEGDLQLELEGPPWVKEGLQHSIVPEDIPLPSSSSAPAGMGSNNHFWSSNRRGAKKWKNLFTVVSKGEIRLFSFNSHTREDSAMLRGQGDGDWWNFADCLASFNLCSCYAQTVEKDSKMFSKLKSTYESLPNKTGDETYWVLNLPIAEAKKMNTFRRIYFYAGTKETAQEFVKSCNFWSARTSAIPPEESISSMEYGWSPKMLQYLEDKKVSEIESYLSSDRIAKWQPIMYGSIPTNLPMFEQLKTLKSFYFELEAKFRVHRELDSHFDQLNDIYAKNTGSATGHDNVSGFMSGYYASFNSIFSRTTRHSREANAKNIKTIKLNYYNKLNYMDNELLRFKSYILVLEWAIKLRTEKLMADSIAEESSNL
ncbi:hypothetical protein CANARDRAFT_174380 [[Candida] arabinofermentans NRRL YB-2248]|uniref:SEC7 domain-containing protein n=1 Tax=[Candida] arabinofermentans NRRL YB-2248 TaxID=983967 RepID=A0A1E4T6H2_9ASCO|nr:hypothetical protein CANARDRAFT_174380 [[Candida] arabinofermentans NRRL YB-2248]